MGFNFIKKYLFLLIFSICFSQLFNINHHGVNRTYYVSSSNNPLDSSPLIINMHGFGMTALDEYQYTEMDYYAHPENIIVVYPQGINNSWNVGTYWDSNTSDDVDFINVIIDEIIVSFVEKIV